MKSKKAINMLPPKKTKKKSVDEGDFLEPVGGLVRLCKEVELKQISPVAVQSQDLRKLDFSCQAGLFNPMPNGTIVRLQYLTKDEISDGKEESAVGSFYIECMIRCEADKKKIKLLCKPRIRPINIVLVDKTIKTNWRFLDDNEIADAFQYLLDKLDWEARIKNMMSEAPDAVFKV